MTRIPRWLLPAAVFVAAAGYVRAACPNCSAYERICGPASLDIICRSLGVNATLDELVRLSGVGENGTTLDALRSAAESKGLHAVGMKISAEELARGKVPAIAHFWGGHFVVVEPSKDGMLRVTDPPDEPVMIALSAFKTAYSGFALLISKSAADFPNPDTNGPDVRFDAYSWDFGTIVQGERASHTFRLSNVGNRELIVSDVSASCDCLTARWSSDRIPAGGEGEITVEFDGTGRTFTQSKDMRIASNDPITPFVRLAVSGYVRSLRLRFSPKRVDFGERRRTETARAELYVPSSSEDPVQVEKVSSDTPFIEAAISPAKSQDRPGTMIILTLKPGAPIGQLNGLLTIESSHPRDPTTRVPVSARIRGDIALDHDAFFFGLLKKGAEGRSVVTMTNAGDEPLRIAGIDNPLSCLSIEQVMEADGRICRLVAVLAGPQTTGPITGTVVVHTSSPDQPEITIPVRAFVED